MDVDAIRRADVDPRARAETLSPADFVRLAKAVPAAQ
jgi:16S rRNA (adenine1518-N6/adenine1519-N6)-dimethyltransferase